MGEAKSVRVMGHRHAISKPLPPYAILTFNFAQNHPKSAPLSSHRHAPSLAVQGVAL